MSELWKRGASDLASRIRAREVSSREVVEAHFSRISEVNDRVNAVTVCLDEAALAAADSVDRALASGAPVGPLGGVPFTIKENIDVAGSATTHGLRALESNVMTMDAPFVAELRRAGAIPIARTNLPDLGSRWHTENDLRGATKNPWNAQRTPGGSSGGEAAALASGMTPLGLGNDIAGSLRWPSQCCGTTALKPSLGRMSFSGHAERSMPLTLAHQLLAVHGPMARHVADLRLALANMCADANGDPWFAPVPLEGPPLARRVSVVRDPDGCGVAPEIANSIEKAARALADAGYATEESDLPALARGNEIYFQVMTTFGPPSDSPVAAMTSESFRRFWDALAGPWARAGGRPAADIMAERRDVALQWDRMQTETPLLLMPVVTQPAFPLAAEYDEAWLDQWLVSTRAVTVVNLLGLPSVAVATHEENGLPHGIQVVGPRFREDLCLDAAQAIEERLGTLTPIEPR